MIIKHYVKRGLQLVKNTNFENRAFPWGFMHFFQYISGDWQFAYKHETMCGKPHTYKTEQKTRDTDTTRWMLHVLIDHIQSSEEFQSLSKVVVIVFKQWSSKVGRTVCRLFAIKGRQCKCGVAIRKIQINQLCKSGMSNSLYTHLQAHFRLKWARLVKLPFLSEV